MNEFKPIGGSRARTKVVQVRLSDEEYSKVEHAAKAISATSCELIRQCIFYALDNLEAKP